MNTIIRDWMPRQARQADKVFQKKFGKPSGGFLRRRKYQLMHLELFPFGIIHAECIGGDIDLLLNRRVDDRLLPLALRRRRDQHRALCGDGGGRRIRGTDEEEGGHSPRPRFGDCYDPKHVEQLNRLTAASGI